MMQIYLSHARHGKKIAIDLKEADADKKNGWREVTQDEYFNRKPKAEPKPEPEKKPIDADLVSQYEAKHGKKPHHRMSEDSIRAAVAE